jgi:hypothetical protein
MAKRTKLRIYNSFEDVGDKGTTNLPADFMRRSSTMKVNAKFGGWKEHVIMSNVQVVKFFV